MATFGVVSKTMSTEALEPMKQAARKFSAFAQELPPLPTGDDGSIDDALLDLDQKLSNWTDSMLKVDEALTEKLKLAHKPEPAPVSVEPDREAVSNVVLKTDAPPEPPSIDKVEKPAAEAGPGWSVDDSPLVAKKAAKPAPKNKVEPTPTPADGEQSWPSAPAWPDAQQAADKVSAKPAEANGKSAGKGSSAKSDPRRVRGAVDDSVREKLEAAAAEDDKVLKALDTELARRVRKLRRLDPYTKIDELVIRARETAARELSGEGSKAKSSWWRRK